MPIFNAQYLFDHYCELGSTEKKKFKRLVKEHEDFGKNLRMMAHAIDESGPEAVRLALMGRKSEAKEAAAKYKREHPTK